MNSWASLTLLFAAGCTMTPAMPSASTVAPSVTTLFISADLRGYIGPCGCSENMQGGIARAAFQVAKAHDEGHPVVFVDSGNALFSSPTIAPEAVPQQERKAKALAEAFKAMGLAGRSVGPLDNARGEVFRASLGLKELTPIQLVTPGVAVVTAANLAGVAPLAAEARSQGARFVVALVQQSFSATVPAIRSEALIGSADLLVAAQASDELSTEDNKLVGQALRVAQVQSKGRSLLRVDVTQRGPDAKVQWLRSNTDQERELSALAERIELLRAQVNEPMLNEELKALRKGKLEEIIARKEALAARPLEAPTIGAWASARFIELEASFEQLPSVKEIVTSYDRDVGLLNVAWAKAHGRDCEAPTAASPGYVGTSICIACHPAAGAFWQTSKHALAYQTLERAGKNNHLDCVGCHVTGWQKPGGVCRIDKAAGRGEVGCESCHGAGSGHVAKPTKATIVSAVGATTCVGCHDRENAPHFSFEAYLEKVVGPGHGR